MASRNSSSPSAVRSSRRKSKRSRRPSSPPIFELHPLERRVFLSQTPYGGKPWLIDGVIQAEHFDNGGEGVAYHDTTAANDGAAASNFRTIEGVDVNGNMAIGWTIAGEWMEYTVQVAKTGTYDLISRVATTVDGRYFHIEMDGVDITGPINVPNTGSWSTYVDVVTPNVQLTAGTRVMRVVLDTSSCGIDSFTFNQSSGLSVPRDLSILPGSGTNTELALSWSDRATSETGFRIEKSTDGVNFSLVHNAVANVTSYTFTSLTPRTRYWFRVRSFNGSGDSGWSDPVATSTHGAWVGYPPPNLDTLRQAEAYDSGGQGVAFYDTTSGNVDTRAISGGTAVTQTAAGEWLTFSTLPGGGGYFQVNVRVSANQSGGTFHFEVDGVNLTGPISIPNTGSLDSFTTVSTSVYVPHSKARFIKLVLDDPKGANFDHFQFVAVPIVPFNLAAIATSNTQIKLEWTDSSSNESGFKIERSTNGTTWTQIATVAAGVKTYDVNNLTPGATYYFRVRSYNASGNSTYSLVACATTIPLQTTLAATPISDSRIDLSWIDVAGETGYTVQRSTNNGDWTELVTLSANVTSYSDTGLTEGTRYYYRIKSFNNAGDAGFSSSVEAVTWLALPTDFNALAVSSGHIDLAWNDHSQAEEGYVVERKLGPGGTWETVANLSANSTSHRDGLLLANTEYYYRIRATNALTTSLNSDEQSSTTYAAPDILPVQEIVTYAGTPVNLAALYITTELQAVYSVSVDWGDGTVEPGSLSGSEIVAFHTYTSPANLTLTLTLTEELTGRSDVEVVSVEVRQSAFVDLAAAGLAEADEESIGRYVPLNYDHDEDNRDANGAPLPDILPDDAAGDRVNPADSDLRDLTLTVDSPEGTWRLVFPENIAVWQEVAPGSWVRLESSVESEPVLGRQVIRLKVEGIENSVSVNDVELRAYLTTTSGIVVEDAHRHTVGAVDLDIDSDDDNFRDLPELDASEDQAEQVSSLPGKVVYANDNDTDGDGAIDFADWSSGDRFVPVVLYASRSLNLDQARFQFVYSASNPQQVSGNTPAPGHLRLWTVDGTQTRDPRGIAAGGHYLAPGEYSAAQIGLPFSRRERTLWLEGISPTTDLDSRRIEVRVDPDGAGPAGFEFLDSVFVTVEHVDTLPGVIRGYKWHDTNQNGIRDKELIADSPSNIIFVVDVSGSTRDLYRGQEDVGNVNGDGLANSILDGELAGFIGLNQYIVGQSFAADTSISIVIFGSSAAYLDMNPTLAGLQMATSPLADLDQNGAPDVEQILSLIQNGEAGVGLATNYEAALQESLILMRELRATAGETNVVFLSDGYPTTPDSSPHHYLDEVTAISGDDASPNILRAFGAGTGASLEHLRRLDPAAAIFTTVDELIGAFNFAAGREVFKEPGVPGWRIYADLNNNGYYNEGEPFDLTDANGNYAITGLDPGQHVIREEVRGGWTMTSPTPEFVAPGVPIQPRHVVSVGEDQVVDAIHFGNYFNAKVDLDIDSDNNNGFGAPDRNSTEESREWSSSNPGKIIDADGRGRPLVLDLSQYVDVEAAGITFRYDGATTSTASDRFIRIWKVDPGQQTPAASEYVVPGKSYSAAALGLSESNKIVTLWVEGIQATRAADQRLIKVEVDPDGPGRLSNISADHVYVTVRSLGAYGSISGHVFRDRNRNRLWDRDLIRGDEPDIVFIIDSSGSTGQGVEEDRRILDVEVEALAALNQQLVDRGFGASANVSVVSFHHGFEILDVGPEDGIQYATTPTTDEDKNGIPDVVDAMRRLEPWGGTYFGPALTGAIEVFGRLLTSPGDANVIMVTDGEGYDRESSTQYALFTQALSTLRGPRFDANIRVFGFGTWGVETRIELMQEMDPQTIFVASLEDLINVFGGLGPGEPAEDTLSGWTIFVDSNGNEVFDSGEPSAMTGADGSFRIEHLWPGQYDVWLVPQAGWVQTAPYLESTQPYGATTIERFYDDAVVTTGQSTELNFGVITDEPAPTADGLSFTPAPQSNGSYYERDPITVTVVNPSGYTENGNLPLRYSYDLNSDGDYSDPGELYRSVSPSATFTVDDGGRWASSQPVRVRIHDAAGKHVDVTAEISIINKAPVVVIRGLPSEVELGDQAPGERTNGLTFPLEAVAVDSGADTAAGFVYAWSATKDGVTIASGTSRTLTLSVNGVGTYNVQVTVRDKDLGETTATATLVVGNSAPQITSISYSPSPVTGTGTTLKVVATDDGGTENLTYYWRVDDEANVSDPDRANGTSDAHEMFVGFRKPGTYTFFVRVADATGRYDDQSVTVEVQQTPSRLELLPAMAVVDVAQTGQPAPTLQLGVKVFDQFGRVMDPLSAPEWSIVSSPALGTIDANGLYTAGEVYGIDTVQVQVGNVTETIEVTINAPAQYAIVGAASEYITSEGREIGSAPFPGLGIAGFLDSKEGTSWGDYSAWIDWDTAETADPVELGIVAPLTLKDGAGNDIQAWEVFGVHRYTTPGTYTFSVTLVHEDAQGTRTKTVSGTVEVAPARIRGHYVSFTPTEDKPFTQTIARIASTDPTDDPSQFSADIDWGDNTSSTNVQIVPSSEIDGYFDVIGSHTYADAGVKTIRLILRKNGIALFQPGTEPTQDIQVSPAVNYDNFPIRGTGTTITTLGEVPFGGATSALATFTDPLSGTQLSDYAVEIDWGDGSKSAGTIRSSAQISGALEVVAEHFYGDEGTFAAKVMLTHGPTNRSATATVTVHVVEAGSTYQIALTTAKQFETYSGPVLYFVGATTDAAGDFTISIDWGDGSTSAATSVVKLSDGITFQVDGSHLYTLPGDKPLRITVQKNGQQYLVANGTVQVQPNSLVVPAITGGFVVSSSQLGIMWTKIPNALGYILWAYNEVSGVKRRIPLETNQFIYGTPTDHDPSGTLYTVDQNLPADTSFLYTVSAVYPDGSISPESAPLRIATPPYVQVGQPGGFTGQHVVVDPLSDDPREGIQLHWGAANVDGYRVFRKVIVDGVAQWLDLTTNIMTPASDPNWLHTLPEGATSVSLLDPKTADNGRMSFFDPLAAGWPHNDPSTPVEYAIVAYKATTDPGLPMAHSLPTMLSVYSDTQAPLIPTGLAAKSYPKAIQLTWNDRGTQESDWAGWNVYRLNPDNGQWENLNSRLITTTLGYNDYSAPIGVISHYRVTAVDVLGNESAPAEVQCRRAMAGEPPAPTGLFGKAAGGGTINLDWDDIAPKLTVVDGQPHEGDVLQGYDVQRFNESTGQWVTLRTAGEGTASSYTDSGLPASTTHRYRVRTVDQDGDYSAWVETSATTGDGVLPATPSLVSQSSPSSSSVSLEWSPGAGGSATAAYRVYRSTSSDSGYTLLPGYASDQSQTSLTDGSLSPGTTYHYRIYAVDADGDVSSPLQVEQATQSVPAAPPLVKITSHAAGADPIEFSADTPIRGFVDDPNNDLKDWQLTLVPVSTSLAAFVVAQGKPDAQGVTAEVGQSPSTSALLGTVRPTTVPDGLYKLRLTATDHAGNPTATAEVLVQIKTNFKLGNFTLPVVDLEVEAPGGGTLKVTRIYDSSQANRPGAFGFGWRVEISDTQLTTTARKSERVSTRDTLRFGDLVYVTLPGGQRHTFQFMPKPSNYEQGVASLGLIDPLHMFYAGNTYEPQFVAVDGSGAVLTVEYAGGLRYDASADEFYGLDNYEPFHPQSTIFGKLLTLTTSDGTQYTINASTGHLVTSTDTNGNLTEYGTAVNGGTQTLRAGGKTLTIHRNGSGRIDWISADPVGAIKVQYKYSAAGDLIEVIDQTGRSTKFTYGDPDRAHFLTKVTDARGVDVISVTYDESGMVALLKDVRNKSAPVSYGGFDGQTATSGVTDLSGQNTEYIYNDYGDVIREIRAVRDGSGAIVKYVVSVREYHYRSGTSTADFYDMISTGKSVMNQLRFELEFQPFEILGTDPRGLRYTATPGEMGSKLARKLEYHVGDDSADPNSGRLASQQILAPDGVSYRETRFENYDALGNPRTIIDENGTSTNVYDASGNLTSSKNPLGEETVYTYTSGFSYTYQDGTVGNYSLLPKGLLLETFRKLPNGTRVLLSKNVYYEIDGSTRNKGRLKSTTDAAGATTFYRYDAEGRVTVTWQERTHSGHGLVRVESETSYDNAGRQTHTVSGRVVKIADGVIVEPGATSQTYYDANGQVLITVDAFGGRSVNTYGARGNLIRVIHADGTETRTVYDDAGRAVWTSERFASTSSYTFDATTGTVTWTGDDNTATYTLTHTVYDSLGRVVRTERYKDGRIEISADTQFASLLVTSAPTLTGTLFATSSMVYDGKGRLVESVDATGLRTGTVYYPNGQVHYSGPLSAGAPADWYAAADASVHFRHRTIQVYDQTDSSQPAGQQRYDQVTDALGHTTRNYRDVSGRVVKTVFHDGSFTETLYGVNGQAVTRADVPLPTVGEGWAGVPLGGQHVVKIAQRKTGEPVVATHYLYDKAGRLTNVWLPAVDDATLAGTALVRPQWRYTYDAYGNQLSQVDPKGRTTSFTYDVLNRRTRRTLPPDSDGITANDSETWTYDVYGRVDVHTDFKGQSTKHVYETDPRFGGRLKEVQRFTAAPDATPDEKTAYAYDALGRQQSVTEYADGDMATPARTTTYGYHPVTGGLTQIVSPEGTINYAYDEVTGRLTRTWTDHNDTTYRYDDLGRLWEADATELNDQPDAAPPAVYIYDAAGNLDYYTLPNGVKYDYTYDALNRLDLLVVTDDDGDKLLEQDFVLESDGQRDYVIENRYDGNSATPFSTVKIDWTYDAQDRLVAETRDEGNDGVQNGLDYTDTYGFDHSGNRVIKTHDAVGTNDDETITSTYNGRDQLTAVDSTKDTNDATYTYDANGSTIRVESNGTAKNYRWDLRNRMTGYDADGDGTYTSTGDATFAYDHNGTRVSKSVAGGESVVYLQDSNNPTGYSQVLEEKATPASVPSRSYLLGNDVIAQSDGSTTSYLLYDGGGHTRGILDATGQPATDQIYAYDAYGNRIEDPANPITPVTNLLYRGEYFDVLLGQYVLRARYYDPGVGRFFSFDSYEADSSDPLSLHKYLYGNGNPAFYVDPTGHMGFADLLSAIGIQSGSQGRKEAATVRGGQAARRALRAKMFDVYLGVQSSGLSVRKIPHTFIYVMHKSFKSGMKYDINDRGLAIFSHTYQQVKKQSTLLVRFAEFSPLQHLTWVGETYIIQFAERNSEGLSRQGVAWFEDFRFAFSFIPIDWNTVNCWKFTAVAALSALATSRLPI